MFYVPTVTPASQVIDKDGVGALVKMAVANGRSVRPKLKCGVCGEHGGDPTSVKFFHTVPLDYVSCSPYRVPVAILAAAQVCCSCFYPTWHSRIFRSVLVSKLVCKGAQEV